MFLEAGWKVFARLFNLCKGDSLCCRFDGEETLSVRAFDADGDHLECCWESSSEADSQDEDDSPDSSASGGNQDSQASLALAPSTCHLMVAVMAVGVVIATPVVEVALLMAGRPKAECED